MSRIGPVEDKAIYQRAREFRSSISSGDVVVKHQNEGNAAPVNLDEVPF